MKRTPMKRSPLLRVTGEARLTVKVRKCPVKKGGCGKHFAPARDKQTACSPDCAVPVGKWQAEQDAAAAARKAAKDHREKRDALKTRRDWIIPTERAVNRYIRLRDAGKGCISCGVSLVAGGVGGGFDAGHYRSKGAALHLRFEFNNIHGQCKRCNHDLAGNVVEFRRGLITRYGVEYVEAIEADQTPRRHSIDEMASIRKLCKQLEKQQ